MTRFVPIFAIACLSLLGHPDAASAQLVRAYILQDSVTVGDRLTLVVVAEHKEGDVVAFPTFEPTAGQAGGTLGDLLVFGPRRQGRMLLGVGYNYPVADTLTYEVTTFALDSAFVPQIAVTVTSNGAQRRAASDPFFFQVSSLVPPDATTMRDITPIAPFSRSLLPFLLAVLVAVAAALAMRWWWKRPPKPVEIEPIPEVVAPVESPIAEAMRRLEALDQTDLTQVENLKPFFVELSECLRTYLERKLGVPALETTTAELYGELRETTMAGRLPGDVSSDIRTILQQADLVKFAKYKYSEDVSHAAVGETRVLLLRIEDQLKTIVPTPESAARLSDSDGDVEGEAPSSQEITPDNSIESRDNAVFQ